MLLSLLSKRTLGADSRDTYGFTVRPQHLERYREYANIYKEEEDERLDKWTRFLDQQADSFQQLSPPEEIDDNLPAVVDEREKETSPHPRVEGDDSSEENSVSPKKEVKKPLGDDSSEENSTSPNKEVQKTIGDDSSEENSNSPKKEIPKTFGDDSSEENSTSPKKKVPKPLGDDLSEENSNSPKKEDQKTLGVDSSEENSNSPKKEVQKKLGDDSSEENSTSPKKKVPKPLPTKDSKVLSWDKISPSLYVIESVLRYRIKKRKSMKIEHTTNAQIHLPSIDEVKDSRGEFEEEDEEEIYDKEILEDVKSASSVESTATDDVSHDSFFHLKQELEFLVHGGVPRNLRGEVWQAFVGVRTRRVEGYYQNMLAPESDAKDAPVSGETDNGNVALNKDCSGVPVKWRKQIEKDLHRTFPGHPALDENGRSSLRRVLLAYARHNPSVGYCQAMNFFAGLLLLMMPEENAFWTLVGIMDDYFDGYYSEQMIESQVDQLVFEELMRQRFPKLVNHLDYLGVQVAWISGPWFLSIFVNMLPWESVLRIWDVILFEGNRVMLFRSALALMELYGPALVTTKDAGDAITLLQSLAGSTFDSSQLVLTACMGFLAVTEDKLQELREKHRPAVIEIVKERSQGEVSKSKSLATKLASFKHGPGSVIKEANKKLEAGAKFIDGDISIMDSAALDSFLNGLTMDTELGSVPDIEEQVVWLKVNLCKLLDEKRSAILRSEELETALMEMVKQDNRRQLSAQVEELEEEVAELRRALSDKIEQENAMLQLLMRVEQEQKVTEDARLFAEQDAAAQRFAVQMLEEKYEKATASIAQMEKRVVMAESMLEATLQYERGQGKALSSPRAVRPETPKEVPTRRIGLLSFGLGWRNRGQQSNAEEPIETKSTSDEQSTSTGSTTTTAQQEPEK